MRSKARNIFKYAIRQCAMHPALTILVCCLIAGVSASFLPTQPHQRLLGWCMAACAGAVFLVWGGLSLLRRLTERGDGICWAGIGFFLRFGYILRFPYYSMQHDVISFDGDKGHAGYIRYLYISGHLPDFDVRGVWQYYHPPLHHLICAGWMHFLHGIGMPEENVYEAVQVLPFAYSCMMLAVFAMLLREFGLKGRGFTIPFAVMAVHPGMIILSGSINNDMLCILFMETALLVMVRWFHIPKISSALQLGLAVGFGMFTKLSAWMAVPAALLLFIWKLAVTSGRHERLHLAGHAVWAGAAGIPIGMFWSVRNLIGWDVPPAYIPMLSEDSGQYVGNHPIWERLLDWSPEQFAYIYNCYTIYGQSYNEYNPLIGLLKTAVFDEFINSERFPAVAGFGEVLFWTQVLLAVLALAAMLWVFRAEGLRAETTALLATYTLVLVSYTGFCLTYPHTCTQSFRYAVPVLYTSLLFLGMFLNEKKLPRWGTVGILSLTGVFVLCSGLLMGVLLFLPAV